jgi:F-type H+-transporting ATPase subunit a
VLFASGLANPVEDRLLFNLGPLPVTESIAATWGVMVVLVAVAAVIRLRLRRDRPGKAQQVVETMLNWLGQEIRNIIGRDPEPFVPLVATLFIFILITNLTSLVSPIIQVKPPTAVITTTTALAAVVFLAVPFYGVAITGTVSYLKTYVRPVWIMLPFNVISDLSRTLALAVRLFGNMLSGEILIGVLLSLVPFFLPLPLMFLGLITGTIQAYIFAILTIVYIGGAVKVVEKHEAKESTP